MLQPDRSYAAILFDMDGTLLDSRAVIKRVLTDWALQNGCDPDATYAGSHGRRTIDVVRDFAPKGVDCAVEAAKIEAAETADTRGIVAVPGAARLLDSLPPDRWAIVTSAGRDLARRRLAAVGLPVPGVFVTAEDIPNGKPHPSGFLLAAEKLGVDAADCLVFEDAAAGIEAGQRAGCDVIAIRYAAAGEAAPDCPSVADFREVELRLS